MKFKKNYAVLLMLLALWSCSKDEDTAGNSGTLGDTRYRDLVFEQVSESLNVAYGENVTQSGVTEQLIRKTGSLNP